MRKIVGILRPFDLHQTLYVYEDSNKIDYAKPTFAELNNTIFALVDQYQINDITFLGSMQFNRGIKNKLIEDELTKYSYNKLNINLL